jgi:hypothetical protein
VQWCASLFALDDRPGFVSSSGREEHRNESVHEVRIVRVFRTRFACQREGFRHAVRIAQRVRERHQHRRRPMRRTREQWAQHSLGAGAIAAAPQDFSVRGVQPEFPRTLDCGLAQAAAEIRVAAHVAQPGQLDVALHVARGCLDGFFECVFRLVETIQVGQCAPAIEGQLGSTEACRRGARRSNSRQTASAAETCPRRCRSWARASSVVMLIGAIWHRGARRVSRADACAWPRQRP